MDVGTVRVGLAVTDDAVGIALPHATLSPDGAVDEILAFVSDHGAGIVVGWPLDLDGRTGRATRNVEVFLEKLASAADERDIELHIVKRDERLTSVLAESLLSEANVFGRRRKEVVDQVAAVQILQAFLEEDGEVEG